MFDAFRDEFFLFIDEHISDILIHNKKNNPKYIRLLSEQDKYSEKFPALFENDSPADLYFGALSDTTACENQILYLQGMKDCVKLLKEIGLLN